VFNTHGFEVPCIWIPRSGGGGGSGGSDVRVRQGAADADLVRTGFTADMNALPRLEREIQRTVLSKVQSNMTTCQKDCKRVTEALQEVLATQAKRVAVRGKWSCYVWLLWPWFLVLGGLSFLDLLMTLRDSLPDAVSSASVFTALQAGFGPVWKPLVSVMAALGAPELHHRLAAAGVAFLLLSTLVQFFKCRSRGLKIHSPQEVAAFRAAAGHVEVMAKHVTDLYAQYVRASQVPEIAHPAGVAAAGDGATATPARAGR